MNSIYLNFFGLIVCLESEWESVIQLIQKDFSIYNLDVPVARHFLKIQLFKSLPDKTLIPCVQSKMQSMNSITYQIKNIRYNDYYGKLISIFDYDLESALIYSLDEDKAHEVIYLLILSRIGKQLDLQGLHKLHAFAVSYRDTALVCMMPTKGGKSTLLLELIKNPGIKIISDDIPLINRSGELIPFPIKIGLNNFPDQINIENPDKNIYTIKRDQHGLKYFISLAGLSGKVCDKEKVFSKIILIEAFRFNAQHSELEKASKLMIFRGLFKHGIIGIGLPMIIEYFWEFGFKDFLRKTYIFLSRTFSFIRFSQKSNCYHLKLGLNSEQTAKLLIEKMQSEFSGVI